MKFVEQSILLVGVHLVNREKKWLAGTSEKTRQLAIGSGDFGASIDHHNNGRRFFECDPSLPKNLRRNEVFIIRNDAARIHHAKLVPAPFDLAIEAVTRDAGLVSDDGAPRSGEVIEQC